MKFTGWKLFCISFALTLPLISICCVRSIKSSNFDNNCTYHVKQALKNPSYESSYDLKNSISEMDTAIQYLKDNKLTNGFTSIIDYTDNDDIGSYYNDLLDRDNYLHSLSDTSIEELDKYKKYVKQRNLEYETIHYPEGISVYPHNVLYCILTIIFTILAALGLIGIIVFIDEKIND